MVENANMGIYYMLLAFLAGLWLSVNMILDWLKEWTKRPSVKEIILAILVSLGTLFIAAVIGIILWTGVGIIFIIFGGILDLIFDIEPDGVMGWMAPHSTWCYIFTLIGFLCTSVLPTCRSFAREEGIADDNDWREVLSLLLLFICIVIVIVFMIVNLIGSCF